MIDLHCHILPGVDDGSPDMETSLLMARMAVESGVTAIAATPHANLPYTEDEERNFASQYLHDRVRAFRRALQENNIPLKIYTGSEVLCTPEVPELFETGNLFTINHSDYLLTEFFFDEPLEFIDDMLHAIMDAGARPILAHPERYESVQELPMAVDRWFREGVIIQVNKGSILGRFGEMPEQTALRILDAGQAHIVASDAHNYESRTPHMAEVADFLKEHFDSYYADILLNRNPARIVDNLDPVDV